MTGSHGRVFSDSDIYVLGRVTPQWSEAKRWSDAAAFGTRGQAASHDPSASLECPADYGVHVSGRMRFFSCRMPLSPPQRWGKCYTAPYWFCTGAATVYQRQTEAPPGPCNRCISHKAAVHFSSPGQGHRAVRSCPSLNPQAPPVISTRMRTVRQCSLVLLTPCCASDSYIQSTR